MYGVQKRVGDEMMRISLGKGGENRVFWEEGNHAIP